LMPAEHRFPRIQWPSPPSDESPSTVRPFVLRGAKTGDVLPVARHRTPATRVPAQPVPMSTLDGKNPRQVPDPYYVPDD
jgi:hypothetical protein